MADGEQDPPPVWVRVLVWVLVLGATWWLVARWLTVGDRVGVS